MLSTPLIKRQLGDHTQETHSDKILELVSVSTLDSKFLLDSNNGPRLDFKGMFKVLQPVRVYGFPSF